MAADVMADRAGAVGDLIQGTREGEFGEVRRGRGRGEG